MQSESRRDCICGRSLIPTGVHYNVPENYEIQVRSKSGLALNQGLMVLNSPGTVDQGYTGEIKVILINHGKKEFIINDGERIAQMVITKHERVVWKESKQLEESERGTGGFGSTGK